MLNRKITKFLTKKFTQYKETAWSKKKHIINRAHIKKYEALPDFLRITPKDPFDYPLRNKKQIEEDLKIQPTIPYKEIVGVYFLDSKIEEKKRKMSVTFEVDMKKVKLTKKQKQRMLFLVGDQRYNKKNDSWKMTINHYPEPYQNIAKGREMLQEIYLEALRAP